MKVFSRSKYIEVIGKDNYDSLTRDAQDMNWVDEADGHEVKYGSIIGTEYLCSDM